MLVCIWSDESGLVYIVDCKVYLYFEIQVIIFGSTPVTNGAS